MYSKEFVNLVENSFLKSEKLTSEEKKFGNPYYIGFGNPNSTVLILGKEKGFNIENEKQFEYESLLNPLEWKTYVDNSIKINKNKFHSSEHYINAFFPYLEKSKSGHTWTKYETLLKNIYPEIVNEENDFFNHCFISEINFKPSKYSKIRSFNDQKRIEFLGSKYFKKFNVIILACGNYLDSNKIEEIFDVKYDKNSDLSRPRERLRIYRNGNRILINTRQLSFDVSNNYLKEISNQLRDYL